MNQIEITKYNTQLEPLTTITLHILILGTTYRCSSLYKTSRGLIAVS